MTVEEIIELIKNAQTNQISKLSGCNLFWDSENGLFEISVYKEHVESSEYPIQMLLISKSKLI